MKRNLNSNIDAHDFPLVKQGIKIPKIIHQTYQTCDLPIPLKKNIQNILSLNPGWKHCFYDDSDIIYFIKENYGNYILEYFNRINEEYGAAKSDFFRYLLIYKIGGIYLDIKSNFLQPIDKVIQENDQYLLSKWDNKKDGEYNKWGCHRELDFIDGGEFQQWHIISVPGHPFLRSVINAVLTNIDRYNPLFHGIGGRGVWRVTGPIAYTLAIHPLLSLYPHRLVKTNSDLGLQYSRVPLKTYRSLQVNYRLSTKSIIELKGYNCKIAYLYTTIMRLIMWYKRIRIIFRQNFVRFIKKVCLLDRQ